jgi:hypothetical protein
MHAAQQRYGWCNWNAMACQLAVQTIPTHALLVQAMTFMLAKILQNEFINPRPVFWN